MILASIGSNYSLETNSLSVCHRKYLLKYLAVPVLAVVLATLLGKEETPHAPSQGKCHPPLWKPSTSIEELRASDMMALFSLAQAFFWQYVFKNYHRPVNIEGMTLVQLLNCTPYSRLSSDEWQSWIQHPGIWRIRSFELCISGSLASANQIQPQHWLTFQISNTRAFSWLDLKKDGTYHIIKLLIAAIWCFKWALSKDKRNSSNILVVTN